MGQRFKIRDCPEKKHLNIRKPFKTHLKRNNLLATGTLGLDLRIEKLQTVQNMFHYINQKLYQVHTLLIQPLHFRKINQSILPANATKNLKKSVKNMFIELIKKYLFNFLTSKKSDFLNSTYKNIY